ncbi:SMODS domain-containing nucleotidyltransferase [Pseudomonas syringae]|uniref:SMODS domain-containing nucleotidyltransferase n=1 Tax=Pseudomonas syringae TaxID=317 RepID=UPI0011D0ACDB|nr:nucleotidyltransferase [Pseudomonas syringae]
MKLLDQFKSFLSSEVNLNDTRVSQLGASVEAVQKAIKASSWGPKLLDFDAHGSWAHGTIIKPCTDGEFDADLLVIVEPVEGWEAKDYVNNLGAFFDGHSTYKDKVHRYSHCVTIEYAGERRIDIAPCVKGRLWPNAHEVCNRTANEFETTAALEYTDWVISRNSVAGGNDLRKVTRLLKYLRDIKTNFTCPSFLFTTLVGMHIYDSDSDTAAFADTPTCLKTLMGRLDDYLQERPTVPVIRNPVLSSDIQSRAWDQTKYGNFREKINLYRTWIDEAFGEADRDESIGKWQRVFGDSFAASEAKESARLSESVSGNEALALAGQYKDLVQRVIERGLTALPERMTRLPYVQRPKWRPASKSYHVKVSAELLNEQKGRRLGPVTTLQPLPKGNSIRFTASNSVGLPFASSFKVRWRVTNTDLAAYDANSLRGDFYASDSGFSREEDLAYRGVHFVEAFLIGKGDNRLYGKSEPFYVVVE